MEYEDECQLTSIANLLPDEPVIPSTTIHCNTQANLELFATPYPCTYIPSASIDGQARLKFTLVSNSILHTRSVNLYVTSNCYGIPVTTLEETFSDNITYYQTGHSIVGAKNMTKGSGGYIEKLVLYKTDSTGTLVDSAISIVTTPFLTPYLTGPAGTVNQADLYFPASAFETAFTMLLQNAIGTLYGSTSIISPNISFDSSGNLFLYTKAKHNPSGEWVGINTSNGKHSITYYNGLTTIEVTNTVSTNTNASTFNYPWLFTSPCSASNPATVHSNGQLMFVPATVNFNNVTFTGSNYSSHPIYTTAATENCTIYSLVADPNTTGTIVSTTWYNAADEVVDTTVSYETVDLETYTFELVLSTGCSFTESVTIP